MATIFPNPAAQDYPSQSLRQAFRLHDYEAQEPRLASQRPKGPLHRDGAAVDAPGTPSRNPARTSRFDVELNASNLIPTAVLVAAEALIISLALLAL